MAGNTPFTLTSIGQTYYTKAVSTVKGGNLINCVSDTPNVVAVSSCTDTIMTLIPKQEGKSDVTVTNELGHRAKVTVNVN